MDRRATETTRCKQTRGRSCGQLSYNLPDLSAVLINEYRWALNRGCRTSMGGVAPSVWHPADALK